jgi:hypothetical protein
VTNVAGSSENTITFPISFVSTGLSLVAMYGDVPNSASIPTVGVGGQFNSLTTAQIANGSSSPHTIYWIAIGV